ncbi:MAG: hypothetical protein EON91_02100 [Brevundimonas sp.]|uniref:imm11 family protein n=1 Tax=Brevundimonas sp. TaxID=1871086 RepID=UPI0011FEADB8|nr:DUF1629 domain-containing protein [Brevundimonas sp.]RZJ19178.1 MAG: hypothetical protein EON91_02100 [Brevundimonas sp.]
MELICWLDDDEDLSFAHLLPDRIPALDRRGYKLGEGGSCADWFPRDLVIPTWDPQPRPKGYRTPLLMDPYAGRGERMVDILPNAFGWRVVSPRLKTLLEGALRPDEIEFLPIHVRRAEQVLPYFIAHPLIAADCIDMEKSEGMMSSILKGSYFALKTLVLDPKRIPAGVRFFRAARHPDLVLIDRDLAQAIVDDDHEGGLFCFPEDFGDPWCPTEAELAEQAKYRTDD